MQDTKTGAFDPGSDTTCSISYAPCEGNDSALWMNCGNPTTHSPANQKDAA